MYVQITTRCNMTCEHCGMNCTNEGEDMSMEIFKACLKEDDIITLGGGEPTIHPDFWNFLVESIATVDETFIITNGSMTETSIILAKLIDKEVIGGQLSLDPYHDVIDERVERAFYNLGKSEYNGAYIGIRDTSEKLVNAGRCDFGISDDCICPGTVVKPNGDVYPCGCDDAPKIGHIIDGYDHNLCSGECYREAEEDQ